jgi:peptidoglycan/LPS O-acetylase OafA/YrhL
LNGIRAIAAYTVVAGHAWSHDIPGRYGVTVFFVLSGFLITRLLLQEKDRTGGVSLRAFWTRRALRIFPAMYVFLAVQWFLGISFSTWLAGAAYYMDYALAFKLVPEDDLSQLWSLAIEEQFYLVWPLVFVAVASRKRLLMGTCAVIIASAAWRASAQIWVGGLYAYYAFDTRVGELLIGCALAIALHLRFRPPSLVFSPWCVLACIALFVAISPVSLVPGVAGVTIASLLAPILILQAIAHRPWVLNNPLANTLGKLSYGIYLYQWIGIHSARWLLSALHLRWRYDIPLVFACTTAIAAVSFYAVELPFLRLKHRLRQPHPTTREPVMQERS